MEVFDWITVGLFAVLIGLQAATLRGMRQRMFRRPPVQKAPPPDANRDLYQGDR